MSRFNFSKSAYIDSWSSDHKLTFVANYRYQKLEIFELENARYVNVDMATQDGIQRAAALGLAPGHFADVIISPYFNTVSSQVFSYPDNPGRMFALFRHPVHRALSMQYYLAKATWDPRYNPKLAKMSMEQYAKSKHIENNWMTRFLVDKPGGKLTHGDMLLAKKIIKFKCLVGLFEDMEVSMARFHRYFGWQNLKDAGSRTPKQKAEVAECRSWHVARGDKHMLHREVLAIREGSVAWNSIVRMNIFDMELYEYVRKIYRIQGEQIFDVVGHEVVREVLSSSAHESGKDVNEEERLADLQPGKSMEVDAFADDSMALDLAAHLHQNTGQSTAGDAFEGDLFLSHSGKSMTLDLPHNKSISV